MLPNVQISLLCQIIFQMSHCSGARLGILWEDSRNVGKNLVQETRETQNEQPNFTPKATRKIRKEEPQSQQKERTYKNQTEINEKEMKETITKISKLKAGSLRR